MKQAHSQADNTFRLLSSNKVLTLHQVASVKASKYAKADHELSLTDILQAHTSYLQHLKEEGWPEKHISALFKFFWNIECHPFHMFMILPLSQTFTPPNNSSTNQYKAVFDDIIHKELSKQQYIGLLSLSETQQVVGHFQSSPLSLIPKPGTHSVMGG